MSNSSIKPQLLPCAPTCGCKFHALAVYVHPTFTVPFQSEEYFESRETSVEELFCGNSHRLKVVGYFRR